MEKRQVRNNLTNQKGFTLMEVMIAIAIFSVFATAFVTGQGYNLLDSSKLKEDIRLKDLCENTINDVVTNTPELREALTLSKETKDFEKYPDYSYTIEYKKFFVPDMTKIMGKDKNDEKGEDKQTMLEKKIFGVFKENMEKILWQVEVTVLNKQSKEQFKLSTWLYNQNAEVKIDQI
jgi:prepilin-type N-terminal cleavage/methylation domain-containing protein